LTANEPLEALVERFADLFESTGGSEAQAIPGSQINAAKSSLAPFWIATRRLSKLLLLS
jgi:hypothetical protein